MDAEPQSCCLEDLETLKTCDNHYLISKTSDTYVAFFSGRPLKIEISWIHLFRIYNKSRKSNMYKDNAENPPTPAFKCYKTITTLTGYFELIIILLHSHKMMFYKGH